MPWLSSRPPGRSSAAQPRRVGVDVGRRRRARPSRSRRSRRTLAGELAVVHDADLDAVGDAGLLGARRARARPAARDSVMPVTWTPWCRRRGRRTCPSRSRRRARARRARRPSFGRRARAWSPGPPRASARRARRSRSCRSSTRRGTARRTRWRRRSGGGPRGRRARSSGAALRAQLGCGRAGGALEARRARRGERRASPWCARSIGGGFQVASSFDIAVDVVDLELARHVGAAEPELARARAARGRGARRAHGERRPAAVGRRQVVPSQKPTVNGRSGRRLGERARAAVRFGAPTAGRSRPRFFALRAGSMRTTSHARPSLLERRG